MGQLRIALTISGAVSLGAYEGGALAALLLGVQEFYAGKPADDDTTVCIDAMGGASAGSITALLAIRTLHAGLDPVYVMYQTWVRGASLAALSREKSAHTPLSMNALEQQARTWLDPTDPAAWRDPQRQLYRQPDPIQFVMSLGCLQGLKYAIRSLRFSTDVEATTYLDLSRFTFTPRDDVSTIYVQPPNASPVDVALASGANEFGFPPKLLDRSSLLRQYVANGVENPSSQYWYTDGGTIDNEPLGHTIDLVNDLDKNLGERDGRLHVLIHPHPAAADASGMWTNPDRQPDWTTTLMRAVPMIRSQNLYDDLRRVEKTNTYLRWVNLLAAELGPRLEALKATSPTTYADWQKGLAQVLQQIAGEKASFPNHKANGTPSPDEGNPGSLVRTILGEISDTAGKNETRVEVISPLLVLKVTGGGSVDELLAGEFLGAFGGFLDEDLRRSDFQLGFFSVLTWMQQIQTRASTSTAGANIDPCEDLLCRFVTRALPIVEDTYKHLLERMARMDGAAGTPRTTTSTSIPSAGLSQQPLWVRAGKMTLASLPLAAKLGFAYLAARVVGIVIYERIFRRFADQPSPVSHKVRPASHLARLLRAIRAIAS